MGTIFQLFLLVSATYMAEMLKSFRYIAPALHLGARSHDDPAAKHLMYLCYFTLILTKITKKLNLLVKKR